MPWDARKACAPVNVDGGGERLANRVLSIVMVAGHGTKSLSAGYTFQAALSLASSAAVGAGEPLPVEPPVEPLPVEPLLLLPVTTTITTTVAMIVPRTAIPATIFGQGFACLAGTPLVEEGATVAFIFYQVGR